ncbi:MAG: hypothetical protein APF77_18780 [Clostridia bacterium BRH_c25]|nr:MAG: hypothetical protein APF77_18780 [Clostridia bacterium BRH_c25]
MSKKYSIKKKNIQFFGFLLLLIAINHLYYQFLSSYVGVWLIIIVEILSVALCILHVHKWFSRVFSDFLKTVKASSFDSKFIEEVSISINKGFAIDDIVERIISYQSHQEKKQQALLDKLKNSNILLHRNSRITDSIMQITSEILSSGEIDEVLQTILDKAIEIIPNAQKGSILIYNGSYLEFRASHGYDSEMLKNLKFSLEELFQYNAKDFYEPCIINNAESFNKEHLKSGKFEVLRDGGGFELKSILSCAIQVDNEFYGVINLDCAEDKYTFSKEDKPLIKHLATQIGIALKNARLIEKILYLSRHDSLTGIYNRCYFEELLMRICQQRKASGAVFSLAILDINDLKKVNDTYGHEAGDLMLKTFAKGVTESLQKDDIFARYGGDEFAIIFTDKTKVQAEEILKTVSLLFTEVPILYCGKKITDISFSFGITEFPAETTEFEKLIKLSDTRMYKNKRGSKRPIRQ